MSWYTDPELFISCCGWDLGYYIDRIVKKYDVPLQNGDISCVEELDFSKHLYLGYNKESDYDAFKSWLDGRIFPTTKFVNCHGLMIHWDYTNSTGTWSRVEEHDSIFYSLPGIRKPCDTVLVEEETISESVAENSFLKDWLNNEVTKFQVQLNQEKSDGQALQTKVLDLAANEEECRCAGSASADAEPWMSGFTVPTDWVTFD